MKIKIQNKHNYLEEGEYVGRPSILENPYKITEFKSRKEVICDYAFYIKKEIKENSPKIISEFRRLLSILMDKKVLTLICWCSPKDCHASIIKEILLNKIYYGSWLVNDEIGIEYNGMIL